MTALEALSLGTGDAVFLDFDGTLAEIAADPDAVFLPDGAAAALTGLSAALGGAVAAISGRDLRDLAGRLPADLWRAGGHGLEILAPGIAPPPAPPPPPDAILAPLQDLATRHGLRLETKGPVAALHFRAMPAMQSACHAAAAEAARAAEGYIWQAGKMVVEVKPAAAHKGRALQHLASRPPFAGRRPVMLGDDTTDEDAIAAAQHLGGIGVKVGNGHSAARLRARDPAEVRAWLTREAGRLASLG